MRYNMKKNTRVILIKTGDKYFISNVIFAKKSGLPYRFEIESEETGEKIEVYYNEIKEVQS